MRKRAAVLKFLLAAAIAWTAIPAAHASAYTPMPIYSMSPTNGATLPLTPHESSTAVVIQSEPSSFYDMIAGIQLEVSPVSTLGQDGTLSNDFVMDYDYLQPSDTGAGYYLARFHNFRYLNPGIYYYQFSGYTYGHDFTASPIYHFVYDPSAGGAAPPASTPAAPDLSMSRNEAVQYFRYLVRHRSGHKASHLTSSCRRTSDRSFRCSVRFRSGSRRYSGRFSVRHFEGQDGSVYWTGAFSGHRSNGRHVHWSI
jgi:hypothetical protein